MEKEAVYERIGGNIRRVRKERGLNQEDVARVLDLTRTAVTNIETGRQGIQVHQLLIIANALKVSADELLDVNLSELGLSGAIDPVDELPESLASMVAKYQTRLSR